MLSRQFAFSPITLPGGLLARLRRKLLAPAHDPHTDSPITLSGGCFCGHICYATEGLPFHAM